MYSDMEAKLMARMRTHNKGRFRTAAIVTVLTVIWVFNTFGKEIRVWMGGQTAEVARETLKHEAIQIQTQELAMAVVNTLLNDPKVLAATSVFLQDAASDPDTQAAIVSLASHVLQHPDTLQEVHALAQKLIAQLVKEAAATLRTCTVLASLKHTHLKCILDHVYEAFLDMVSRIIAEPRVKEQVSLIMADGSHHVLADADVLQHGKDFVAEVMGDDQVQKTGGDALWHSVQYALRWRLMVVAGLSMACAGAIFAGRGWR
ncbi:hypothetical protein JKP88DRAFT_269953 [Tribonema minus]|uniref:Uncharacterized protein n=1 Tax=Tribonema minus TaxID=303371 RepID=A0A835YV69_9STRA|nr:hypothetical protein JKP88DRAFT_269953 [Tribonema minus]